MFPLRLRRAIIQLTPQIQMRFSAGHDDHHIEHAKLDLNKNWVQTSPFVSVEGIQDLHYHEHHDDHDPYAHLQGKGFFTFERFFFGDPHYHLDEDEGLMNQPHGYMTNDDPLDNKNSYEQPALELIYLAQIGLAIGIIYGIHGLDMKPSGEQLYEDNLTAEMLEDEMRKIRIENQKLENRLQLLKEKLEHQ